MESFCCQCMTLHREEDTLEVKRNRLLDDAVRQLASSIHATWGGLNRSNIVIVGFALGVVLGVLPHLAFGWPVMIPGVLVYFPFHFWLCWVAFGVLFSSGRRTLVMGESYSPFGAFFGYLLTTKYGLFCI